MGSLGSVITAGGQLYAGFSDRAQARRAARVDQENARLSLLAGEQDAMAVLREARFQQGAASAGIGQGLLTGGSVATVLTDSARAAELDIERLRAAATAEADNLYRSAVERRKQGNAALIGSVIAAAGTLAGAQSSAAQQRRLDTQAQKERTVRLGQPGGGAGATYSYTPALPARGRWRM